MGCALRRTSFQKLALHADSERIDAFNFGVQSDGRTINLYNEEATTWQTNLIDDF